MSCCGSARPTLRLEPAVADAAPPADTGGDKGPTVAMLTAMVQALSASIQTPEPEAGSQEAEPTPPALATAAEFAPWPVEATAVTELESVREPAAEAAPASMPGETLARETTLLANFEQMEIRPFQPPEEGTAVIFTPRIEPANRRRSKAPRPLPRPSRQRHPPRRRAATAETAVPQFAEPGAADIQLEPLPAAAPAPAAMAEVASAPDVAAAAVEPEAQTHSEAPAESKPLDPYFDPTDFLFGPEPEPDPAAFLLDSAPPQRTQKAVLPQPEFVSTPTEPPKIEELEPQPPKAEAPQAETGEVEQPDEPAREPHDPLHALKAMSPNEKLAIFS